MTANKLPYLWADVLCINPYLAFFLNLVLAIPTNDLLSKCWAFRKEQVRVASPEKSEQICGEIPHALPKLCMALPNAGLAG